MYSPTQIRVCVKAGYSGAVGIREATGRNDGKQVETYLKACGLGRGYPWCAAFIAYTLHQCGVATENNSAWAAAWFKPDKLIYRRGVRLPRGVAITTPKNGDVCGYYFSSKPYISHVGFVDVWGERITITVEGNTRDSHSVEREGDGVYRLRRLTRSIVAVANWIDK